jgi:hypothetical protein
LEQNHRRPATGTLRHDFSVTRDKGDTLEEYGARRLSSPAFGERFCAGGLDPALLERIRQVAKRVLTNAGSYAEPDGR